MSGVDRCALGQGGILEALPTETTQKARENAQTV